MGKKLASWKTKGMGRDLSVSAFNPEFAFENMNLRLSTNEGNTLMSWVNEKGTAPVEIYDESDKNTKLEIAGYVIGTAVLNEYLVLFTTDNNGDDMIYRLRYADSSKEVMLGTRLYRNNMGFSTSNPIETQVSYESEYIQKVYWVDGKNQPRVINIVPEKDYVVDTDNPTYNPFDFTPELKLREKVTVRKILGASGSFAPGVIQYALTYYNKYGQETSIFHTTPLCYISYQDRGGAPDGKVENAFRIQVTNVDDHFDYLRIYSIHRTSLNATPFVKRVQDIEIGTLEKQRASDGSYCKIASYLDTGYSGDAVTPTDLLYKGGEPFIAGTIGQKDGTLFLGNIELAKEPLGTLADSIGQTSHHTVRRADNPRYINMPMTTSSDENRYDGYVYACQLNATDTDGNSVPCGYFKPEEYYRWGVQFQHKSGKWSEPVYLDTTQVSEERPSISMSSTGIMTMGLPQMEGRLNNLTDIKNLYEKGYRRARAVVVFPGMEDRTVLCQGVISPTLYTSTHRVTNQDLYAQSSWFFRVRGIGRQEMEVLGGKGIMPPIGEGTLFYTEGSTFGVGNLKYMRQAEIQGCYLNENKFNVDWGTVTMHSPEVEFDDSMQTMEFLNTGYRWVGTAQFNTTLSDISIQTDTPTISNTGTGFLHKSFKSADIRGIVAGLFYEDCIVDLDEDINTFKTLSYEKAPVKWMVYPWQRNGSLNNDLERPANQGARTAMLRKKVISNLRYSNLTSYSSLDNTLSNGRELREAPKLYSSAEATILKLGQDLYQGNIDTVLNPDSSESLYFAFNGTNEDSYRNKDLDTPFNSTSWWRTQVNAASGDGTTQGLYRSNGQMWVPGGNVDGDSQPGLAEDRTSVRMRYKSTPHIVMRCKTGVDFVPNNISNIVPVVEITRDFDKGNQFGGTSPDALRENTWVPCGDPVDIELGKAVTFYYTYGDTYYQRWDCLKTFPFSHDDQNQIVEICSFMLETRVNMDGRYDRNRGQVNNINVSPTNFNLLNPVYSQVDNFFSYKILDSDIYRNTIFPNQITWTLTKQSGADTDQWTDVTLASVLELDGDKGQVRKLTRLDNQLLAFQDQGIAQILYNENVQVASTEGVPIEIANSGKVQGVRYVSSTIGCSNKWALVTTPAGIYFMDSNDKGIYLFNGQLDNLSEKGGMNTWSKQNIPSAEVVWNPLNFGGFTACYDRQNKDVLFINSDTALAYSEKLGVFTSFYDYGFSPYFCNLGDTGLWLRKDGIWKHQAGDYCNFFGENKPYWTLLVGNPDFQLDKIFTNLEFRACVDGDGEYDKNTGRFTPTLPFDYLETWNEYQHGRTTLSNRNGHQAMTHHGKDGISSLKRRFRIWRCDIPRDNMPTSDITVFQNTFGPTFLPTTRQPHPIDRMRSPWIYMKLERHAADEGKSLDRTEIHDFVMTYYV